MSIANSSADAQPLQQTEVPEPIFARASAIFLTYAASHLALFLVQVVGNQPSSAGGAIVAAVALALVYDNALIGLGVKLFPGALCEPQQAHRLFFWSQPRYIAHAGLTPLLAISATQLGQAAGVAWLQGQAMLWSVICIASLIAAAGLVHHCKDPRLVIKLPHQNAPEGTVSNQLLHCTLAAVQEGSGPDKVTAMLLVIGPAVLVVIWSIVVAATMIGSSSKGGAAGYWLLITALLELFSNAGPPWTMQITGNLGEVIFLTGFVVGEALLRE